MNSRAKANKTLRKWEKLYREAFRFKGFRLILMPREYGKTYFIYKRLKYYKKVAIYRNGFLYERVKHSCTRKRIKGRGC